MSIERLFDNVATAIRAVLERALEGREISVEDGLVLEEATGPALHALCATADQLRAAQVGDAVTYVINRNINFTNVCVKTCKFCAFSRDLRSEEGYFLDLEEVVRRAREAYELGATEVCLQAGLAPSVDGMHYVELTRAVKRALPGIHLHGFSPEEVRYGSLRSGLSVREYLTALKEAGLGTLPGTSAEILDDAIRHRISPGRITTAQWIEVIRTAHELGIPTTSTMMFGHVETAHDRLRHLALLRAIQKETGGFTELVPLSFVHEQAPMAVDQAMPGLQPGPTGHQVARLYAIARLMVGASIPHLQASWVKEGLRTAEILCASGVDDLGGTLMNESISTSAGASHGQRMTPTMLRRAIRSAGRIPVQRTTTYGTVRRFAPIEEPGEAEADLLARVEDPEARFGSYQQLVEDERFRYRFAPRPAGADELRPR
jgi:FO synthase subunit 2